MLGACVEQGPLFSEDVGVDAGPAPPRAGDVGGGGMSGAMPAVGEVGSDAGLVPSGEPLPEPGDPMTPAECDAVDSGASESCVQQPPGDAPPGENPLDEADPCDGCLAGECPAVIDRCDDTPGCNAIVACARSSGCEQDECYCGSINVFLCSTTGQANGPCREVMLAAPGGHPPSLIDPNAGPASVAASEVGECRVASEGCRSTCEE